MTSKSDDINKIESARVVSQEIFWSSRGNISNSKVN